ncbi:MAG: flagellar motor protein MotB [Alphaproteobacteria bacterium]|nr:flagellar motor protein MotB [Alphaproteobacteria bacterium]
MSEGLQGEAIEPLILKKKIKIPAGAHGGAWKVAYADFVTAMMAFFLLLWLLNATTEEQMTGLSDYFAPPSAAEDSQGIGQALSGAVASLEGAMRSASSPPVTSVAIPSYGSEESGKETGEEREDPDAANVNLGDATAEQQEQQMLDDALAKLKQSIQEDPSVRDLQDSIIYEITEDGLLIQLLDYQRREMFEPGTDQMTRRAVRLLALISGIIVQLPNDVAITGHTDSAPQPGATPDYGNWELSGDRAAASRRWMERNGFPTSRLVRVEGKADSDLLDPRDPENERNRRISILLLRQNAPEKQQQVFVPGVDDVPGSGDAGAAPARDTSGLAPPPLPEN